MANRRVSSTGIYVATPGTGERRSTVVGIYVATAEGGARLVTANGMYVAMTSPPAAPTGLTATAVSFQEIELSVTDNTGGLANFEWQWSADGSTGWTTFATTSTPSASHTGLQPNTVYYYRVRALFAVTSAWSTVASARTETFDLTVVAYSSAGVALTTTSTSPDGATGFDWQWSADGSTGWTTFDTTVYSDPTTRHTGLDAETTYYYRVEWGSGSGIYSSVASATTLAAASPAALTLWIDVEDADGNILGPGPLSEVLYWRSTSRMDRVGEIEFGIPLPYGRAHEAQSDGLALLSPQRYVSLYGMLNGSTTLLGRGIVEEMETRRSADGDSLVVRGADLLRELVHTTVSVVNLSETPPTRTLTISESNSAPSFLISNYATFAVLPASWTYSGGNTQTTFSGQFLEVPLMEALLRVADALGEHFRLGDTDRELEWLGRGTSLASSGVRAVADVDPMALLDEHDLCLITDVQVVNDSWDLWTRVTVYGGSWNGAPFQPFDFTEFPHDGSTFKVPISEITGDGSTVTVTTAVDHGWSTGEEVLIAFTTDFDRVSYATITVTGSDTFTYSDTTTGTNTDEGYARVATDFTDSEGDQWDVGSTGVNGYYLHQLANQTAESEYGEHQTQAQFNEVLPASSSLSDKIAAANMLMRQAWNWLRLRARPQQFYRLAVTALDQILYPGDTLLASIHNYRDGTQYLDIEDEFVILEATTEYDETGLRTTDLLIASADRWPETDAELLARQLRSSLKEDSSVSSANHTHDMSIDDLNDVDTSTTSPTDGQALLWDNGNSQWEPGDVGTTGLTIQHGQFSGSWTYSGGWYYADVSFASSFSSTPTVLVTLVYDTNLYMLRSAQLDLANISTTGFRVQATDDDANGFPSDLRFNWVAIEG